MADSVRNRLFLMILSVILTGNAAEALSYDYSASIECLAEPLKPQYGGGILINPEFEHGLNGWSRFGGAHIESRVSKEGNKFIVARSRKQPFDTFSQKLYLHKDKLYTFSAWVQISKGNAPVRATFKTVTGFTHAGHVFAEAGCWSMLKGGLSVNVSGPAELYFESKNTAVEIWVDSASLQPFTQDEWRSHQHESIEKVRKRKVRLHAVDSNGNNLPGATLLINQKKASFPFGSAINKNILNNQAYQSWLLSRFTVTVFENEMKWYSTEISQGHEDYSIPDAMMAFAKQNGLAVRGQNVLWDDPKYQPNWVPSLSPDQLRSAVTNRINSVIKRYAGQVNGWDVVNENLHFSFFEDRLGSSESEAAFQLAHQLDSGTRMFMNEYNTLEKSSDSASSPANYLKKLKEIMSSPRNGGPTGIGLEGHFDTPNIPYMRSALDTLASANVPIWLTEVDVGQGPNQASYLDQILREAHSHPAVEGIVMWTAISPNGCYRMCLTDQNFKNLQTGDVVDKLLGEWKSTNLVGTADKDGFFEVPLFHGDYQVTITHPSTNSSVTHSMEVDEVDAENNTLLVKVYA